MKKRVRSAQETGFRVSGVAIFYIFLFICRAWAVQWFMEMGVFVSERERERNRYAGEDKEKVSVNSSKIFPFFSFMFMGS